METTAFSHFSPTYSSIALKKSWVRSPPDPLYYLVWNICTIQDLLVMQSEISGILKESGLKMRSNSWGDRRRCVKMIVNYYATLRQVVGSCSVDIPLPPG